jgi:hypothetical protein
VRRLLEEQDKVLRSYFAQKELKGGARSQGGDRVYGKGPEHVQLGHVCVKKEHAERADHG